ncbi:hypothetical protein M8C21_019319 [Ambrosia artemisiifolia]|uniref:Uncharacterized protein n=1 Tax=Ambrosia artemisiifolia TaxID=4212 RepID=A0AAD5C4J6_AMBAR|nr:hypothetical protein M8C21_019319 [Ambrosia artemisiifolia]
MPKSAPPLNTAHHSYLPRVTGMIRGSFHRAICLRRSGTGYGTTGLLVGANI